MKFQMMGNIHLAISMFIDRFRNHLISLRSHFVFDREQALESWPADQPLPSGYLLYHLITSHMSLERFGEAFLAQ